MIRRAAVVAVLSLAPLARLDAQQPIVFRGGLALTQMRAHTTLPAAPIDHESLSAAGLGIDATVTRGRFGIAFTYLQSNLAPRLTGTTDRDAAEGEFLLTAVARPWLSVAAGFHSRSYRTGIGLRQRWAMWEVRARVETATLPGNGRGYLVLWPVLAASVNVPEGWKSGFGSEVGFTLSVPRAPVWLRLAYRAEFFRLSADRSELTDGIRLTAGFALSR